MNFQSFQHTFSIHPVIATIEIKKQYPTFDWDALTRWQKKGYLTKIRNGYYRLNNQTITSDADLFFIANRIYAPSYVSLHSALRWYDFIPEGVFITTSISTKKTQRFQTSDGVFTYRSLRKDLFFGYKMENVGIYRFKIASPAKAILDFLYLNPHLKTEEDFFELRLNIPEIRTQMNMTDFDAYLSIFSSKSLTKRVKVFKTFIA